MRLFGSIGKDCYVRKLRASWYLPWQRNTSALEGRTRIPTMVYWAGKIKPNTVSNAMFMQIDLMASFAKMLNEKLPENEFTDSLDYFNTLIEKNKRAGIS